jgi:predicted dehydrogenase
MKAGRLIDRRAFLRRGVGVGAGVGLFHIVPAAAQGRDGRPAPSNRLVMGAVGVGGMGHGNTMGFVGQGDVQFVAVCDVDKGNAERTRNDINRAYRNEDCKAYGDFRELLARSDLDAITIGTPDHWHAIPAVMAMNAGLDVYGEKPITHTLTEGRAVADAQQRHGCVWQTGSWQRSVGNFHWGAEMVRNGRIGKIARVEVGLPTGGVSGPAKFVDPPPNLDYDLWVGPSRWLPYCDKRTHWNWRWQLDFGGGQLMDWIGHHGDIAHWGMDCDRTGPIEIEGKGNYPTEGVWDAATTYRFTCRYRNGVEMVVGNSTRDLRSGTKWIGENGNWIWVDRGGTDAFPKDLLRERLTAADKPLYKSGSHHRNFLDCVKTRTETITPAETAHRSASIGHLGQIAMLTGRKIRWNPDTEQILDDPGATQMLSSPMRAPWRL